MRFHRAAGLLATTFALLAAGVAPAAATSGPRYYTPPTPYHNVGRFDPGCEGLDLRVAYDYEGVYSEQVVSGTNRQAFLFKDDFTFSERWVDRATGKVVLRIHGAYVQQETSATKVPLGQVPAEVVPPEGLVGPVYEFEFEEVGGDLVRAGDGTLLHRTRGTVRVTTLFDTLGDRKPGGTFLQDTITSVEGPHPLLDTDLCDVARAQLTP